MMQQKYPSAGEIKVLGYPGEAIDLTVTDQFLDDSTWNLFVEQYRDQTDIDNGWRGEFWGKMMRGAALTYRVTKNQKLYDTMVRTVEDMLSVQESDGRISSYPRDMELCGWDMWGRKYVLLGMIYFIDICKSESFKKRIIRAMKRHADYVMKRIGEGKRLSVFDTSQIWGGLNSCSILEPFVKLYNLTGEKKYLDFASYLVGTGFSQEMNLIELCLKKEMYPYQFVCTKAYEMMSCFEGLLEYYKIKGDPDHLEAVENFVDMVALTDYTLIGTSGCTHELFDNSTKMQTEPAIDEVMQETCVTVTFMKLCAKLFAITGKAKYVELIEKSGYNAMLGAVNDTHQTMHLAAGRTWVNDVCVHVPHEPYPFDSYSPLYMDKRGKRVGGFMKLENGRSYGCCACIGGAGTAILGLAAITSSDDSVSVNMYNSAKFKNSIAKISVVANPYGKGMAKITVNANKRFTLRMRIPTWAVDFAVSLNGEKLEITDNDGYLEISRDWSCDKLSVSFRMPVLAHVLNGKVAYTRGPVTLARDRRLDDIKETIAVKVRDGKPVRAKLVKNKVFKSRIALEVATQDGIITLCDYSSAGKDYDDENSLITVWQDRK